VKGRRSFKVVTQHNRKVVMLDDDEDEDENDGDEENDRSMDEDEDEVDARDDRDMNPANLFDEVSLPVSANSTCSHCH
jgi:hypothetical protein